MWLGTKHKEPGEKAGQEREGTLQLGFEATLISVYFIGKRSKKVSKGNRVRSTLYKMRLTDSKHLLSFLCAFHEISTSSTLFEKLDEHTKTASSGKTEELQTAFFVCLLV